MEIVEVRSGVFACLTAKPASNAGFVVGDRGTAVIDSLYSPEAGRQLATAVAEHAKSPVLLVVNTHHHSDHVFGNQAFAAPVVAHCALAAELARIVAHDLSPDAAAAWVAAHPEDRWLTEELEIRYPNIAFEDRLVIDLPPKHLVVQHLGGHTPDTIVVDLPDDKVLFAGDLVFEGRTPFLLSSSFRGTVSALSQLEKLGERTVVPGHGALCTMDYVRRYRTYVEALIDGVHRLLVTGLSREAVLESDDLPKWWTPDRPELQRANIARLIDELAGGQVRQ